MRPEEPGKPESREGILEVYDWNGVYRGCIGVQSWERLLDEEEKSGRFDQMCRPLPRPGDSE